MQYVSTYSVPPPLCPVRDYTWIYTDRLPHWYFIIIILLHAYQTPTTMFKSYIFNNSCVSLKLTLRQILVYYINAKIKGVSLTTCCHNQHHHSLRMCTDIMPTVH